MIQNYIFSMDVAKVQYLGITFYVAELLFRMRIINWTLTTKT